MLTYARCCCVCSQGDAYRILHSMCYVSSLLDGTSHLHLAPDGTPLSNPPQDDDVKASVVAAAVDAHLVTRYTAAVGVLVQKDPLDPTKVRYTTRSFTACMIKFALQEPVLVCTMHHMLLQRARTYATCYCVFGTPMVTLRFVSCFLLL